MRFGNKSRKYILFEIGPNTTGRYEVSLLFKNVRLLLGWKEMQSPLKIFIQKKMLGKNGRITVISRPVAA